MVDKIKTELVKAMKEKNSERLSVLRMIKTSVNNYLIDNPGKEDNLVSVLDSMVKQRNQAKEQYLKGNREDLAENEFYEISVISEFLPKRMDVSEIEIEAKEVIESVNASSMKDMGKVMGILKNKLGENAKPSDISQVVKTLLT